MEYNGHTTHNSTVATCALARAFLSLARKSAGPGGNRLAEKNEGCSCFRVCVSRRNVAVTWRNVAA